MDSRAKDLSPKLNLTRDMFKEAAGESWKKYIGVMTLKTFRAKFKRLGVLIAGGTNEAKTHFLNVLV